MNNTNQDFNRVEISGVIYKATNTLNGKVYIGMTVNDFEKRKRNHIAMAKHCNGEEER